MSNSLFTTDNITILIVTLHIHFIYTLHVKMHFLYSPEVNDSYFDLMKKTKSWPDKERIIINKIQFMDMQPHNNLSNSRSRVY